MLLFRVANSILQAFWKYTRRSSFRTSAIVLNPHCINEWSSSALSAHSLPIELPHDYRVSSLNCVAIFFIHLIRGATSANHVLISIHFFVDMWIDTIPIWIKPAHKTIARLTASIPRLWENKICSVWTCRRTCHYNICQGYCIPVLWYLIYEVSRFKIIFLKWRCQAY